MVIGGLRSLPLIQSPILFVAFFFSEYYQYMWAINNHKEIASFKVVKKLR